MTEEWCLNCYKVFTYNKEKTGRVGYPPSMFYCCSKCQREDDKKQRQFLKLKIEGITNE